MRSSRSCRSRILHRAHPSSRPRAPRAVDGRSRVEGRGAEPNAPRAGSERCSCMAHGHRSPSAAYSGLLAQLTGTPLVMRRRRCPCIGHGHRAPKAPCAGVALRARTHTARRAACANAWAGAAHKAPAPVCGATRRAPCTGASFGASAPIGIPVAQSFRTLFGAPPRPSGFRRRACGTGTPAGACASAPVRDARRGPREAAGIACTVRVVSLSQRTCKVLAENFGLSQRTSRAESARIQTPADSLRAARPRTAHRHDAGFRRRAVHGLKL